MKAEVDLIDYTILGQTSQDSDYPVSNLKIYTSSTESYRTTNVLNSVIQIDLGAVYENPIVLIYRTNFSDGVIIKGYPDNTFTTPDSTSSVFPIEQDIEDLKYKRGITATGFNNRYMEIEIPVQERVDGASYFEIGVIVVMASLEDFTVSGGSLGLPVDVELVPSEEVVHYETNRKDVFPTIDIPVLEFRISGTMLNSKANRQKVARIFANPLKSLVYMDRSSENSWQVYLMQRTGVLSMSEQVGGEAGIRSYSMTYETIL